MVGCAVNRARRIMYSEDHVASANDPRNIVDYSGNRCGLVRSKSSDSSLATEMSISSLVRFEESELDRKSTRLNSSHVRISYAVFCLKKKKKHDLPCDMTPVQ